MSQAKQKCENPSLCGVPGGVSEPVEEKEPIDGRETATTPTSPNFLSGGIYVVYIWLSLIFSVSCFLSLYVHP